MKENHDKITKIIRNLIKHKEWLNIDSGGYVDSYITPTPEHIEIYIDFFKPYEKISSEELCKFLMESMYYHLRIQLLVILDEDEDINIKFLDYIGRKEITIYEGTLNIKGYKIAKVNQW